MRDEIIQLLAARQSLLLAALEHRGHAAMRPVRLAVHSPDAGTEAQTGLLAGAGKAVLPASLVRARANPEWSSMGRCFEDSQARQRAIAELAATDFVRE